MPSSAPYRSLQGNFFAPAPFWLKRVLSGDRTLVFKMLEWALFEVWTIKSLRCNPGILQGFLKTPEFTNQVFYGVLGVIFQVLTSSPVYADRRKILMNIRGVSKREMLIGGPG
jgi:hypothetical protein